MMATNELGLGFWIFILQHEGDDFDEIVVQLVEGVGLGVRARQGRDVAGILPGDWTAFDDGGEGAHGARSFRCRKNMRGCDSLALHPAETPA